MAYHNRILPEDMRAPPAIGMPIEEVRLLPKREQAKFVLYHARQVGFNSLGDAFLVQLQTIPNRHCEGFNTACTILHSPYLQEVYTIMKKDRRFTHMLVNTLERKYRKK